jgi:flagellar basal body rod protein FlgF
MDNASYTTLTRQSGLMQEMQILANNIANASTTGFRAEGLQNTLEALIGVRPLYRWQRRQCRTH